VLTSPARCRSLCAVRCALCALILLVCGIGSYCPSTSAATAVPCPAGTYSYGSQSACTWCAAGYACAAADGSANAPCAAGTYSTANSTTCTPCPAVPTTPLPSLGTFSLDLDVCVCVFR
jgi:hypothetical protein